MPKNNANLVWGITKDHLNEPDGCSSATMESEVGTWGNKNGVCLIRGGKVKGTTHAKESTHAASLVVPFRIKDDDGELYYTGKMTKELADSPDVLLPLDDFAMPNAGATTLELWNDKTNSWEAVN